MARAHAHLLRLLKPQGRPLRTDWPHLLGSLAEVCGHRSEQSTAVLRKAATFQGKLLLDRERGLPHSMSPEDFLRSVAVQTLGRWNRTLHRDVIVRATALADHECVLTYARPYLP